MRIRYIRARLAGIMRTAGRNGRRSWVLLLMAAAMFFIFCLTLGRIRPVLTQVAQGMASDIVSTTVNRVIAELMGQHQLDYSELVTLEKNADGSVTALVANMARINVLQAEITGRVVEELAKQETSAVRIPVGNLLGGVLLSGRGPYLKVKIVSVSNVDTEFYNAFSAAGINQTRHQIMLNVDVRLSMLLPGGSTDVGTSTQVCVAETVIVGDVPQSYMDIEQEHDHGE